MASYNYNKKLEDYLKDYEQARAALNNYQKQNNPGNYISAYSSQMSDYMNKLNNRQPFSYDAAYDPTYQQYRRSYMAQGKLAMQDTVAQASALTGGYGNSWAQSVGQQVYNKYAADVANKIPELEQIAYQRYANEGNELRQNLAMYQQADALDYEKYRNRVADYQNMLNYYTGRADTAYNRGSSEFNADRDAAYQMWRAQTADEQAAAERAEAIRQYNEKMAFQREQYEYQKQQDAAALAYKYAAAAQKGTQTEQEQEPGGKPGTKKSKEYISVDNEDNRRDFAAALDRAATYDKARSIYEKYYNDGYNKDMLAELWYEYEQKSKADLRQRKTVV